jgi:serine/threonine-protein kinase
MNGASVARLLAASSLFLLARAAKADAPNAAPQERVTSRDAAAAAQGLFVEGKRLVAEGRYPEGCDKLEQSNRLDPAVGTQINLADCYEKIGKLASAWFLFHEAVAEAQRAKHNDWAEQARQRARSLEPVVPKLTIVVDEPVPNLEVLRGTVHIEPSTFGSPVPLDPGTYDISAAAPRHRPWTARVAVESGAQVVFHVPPLSEEPPAAGPDAEKTPERALPLGAAPASSPHAGTGQRIVALALGAAGVVAAGVGIYAGFSALTSNHDAAARCPASPRCTDPQAIAFTEDAQRAATASTVSFVASGVLIAAALGVFFTAPSSRPAASIAISVGPGNVLLSDVF